MASKVMYEVMRQTAALPLDEKLRLLTVLTEQVRLATHALSNGTATVEGQQPVGRPDKPETYRRREYAWLKEHRHEYPGEYLALDGDRLVSHGSDGRGVLEEARRAGVPLPLLVRVEAEVELPFCGGW